MTPTKTGRTNKSPQGSERDRLIGQRMKLAAAQVGIETTVEMAEAMFGDRKYNPTVSRWWTGKQRPNHDDLDRYAEIVRKPLSWFFVRADDEGFDWLAESLMEIVNLTMEGRDLAEAHRQVTGEIDRFGTRERRDLAAGTEPLRREITRRTEADWQALPDRQRRQVIDRLSAEALGSPEE